MPRNRLVGLARIAFVAASLALAGGASLGVALTAAGGTGDPIRTSVNLPAAQLTPVNIDVPCRRLRTLMAGASIVGDAKQAHDFQLEYIAFGCR